LDRRTGHGRNERDESGVRTVSFKTLGCRQNQYDTDYLKETFREKGFRVVESGPSDLVVVNTCAVTARSAAKCRQAIRAAARTGAKVLVTGCYSQVASNEVADIPGVLVISGVRGRAELASLAELALAQEELGGLQQPVDQIRPLVAVTPHDPGQVFQETPVLSPTLTRAYLKVQEGCGDLCAYCIVPFARGPSRSRHPEKVLQEARRLVRRGYKELVLTGTHLGLYGEDFGTGKTTLPGLVKGICEIPGLLRLRLSSLEPHDVTPDLIHCLRYPQVCQHLHLPLQSGSERVLRAMGRRYTAKGFLETLDNVRKVAPDVGVSTDIIAGFPGETDQEHEETLTVAAEAGFSRMHVFKFSARPGTRAWEMPGKVPEKVKADRARQIADLGLELSRRFHSKHIGRDVEVLVENDRTPEGFLTGVTRNYVRCYLRGHDGLKETLQNVRCVSLAPDGVFCEMSMTQTPGR
jgi:threonylcarbamoyladenosine tRNA methylthiotransferase MtaB